MVQYTYMCWLCLKYTSVRIQFNLRQHYVIFSVCKFKAHKRCAVKASSNCKWTTLAAIGAEIIEEEDGVSVLSQPICSKHH